MALIWCSISSHGFGHAAQVVPVLNELWRRIPDLKAILRTQLPATFFGDRLLIPWVLSPAVQDIGCRQRGPLMIDVDETWAAHVRFHADWESKVRNEAEAMTAQAPDRILADISHLAAEAGSRTGIPTIGLCNLSWDLVLERYLAPGQSNHVETVRLIQQAYGQADLMIRPTPGLPLPAFR